MSDFTPPSGLPGTPRADAAAPLSRGEQALKILSADGDLGVIRRPVRLEGEVAAVSRDGTTATIRTERGTVEVRQRPQAPLEPGQKVQVDIPAGQPPRQLVVRPAPQTTEPQQPLPTRPPVSGQPAPAPDASAPKPAPSVPTVPLPPQVQPGATQPVPVPVPPTPQPAAPPAPQTPPLPPDVRAALDTMLPAPAQPAPAAPLPLPPDTVVRLVPLPGMPPQSALRPPLPSLPTVLPAQIDLTPILPPQIAIATPPDNDIAALLVAQKPPAGTIRQDLPAPAPGAPLFFPPATPLPAGPVTLLQNFAQGPVTPDPSAPLTPVATLATPVQGPATQAIALPLRQQIIPFITPVTDQDFPAPLQAVALRVMTMTPPMPALVEGSDTPLDNTGNPAPAFPPATPQQQQQQPPSPITLRADVVGTTARNFPVLSMQVPGRDAPDTFLLQFPASNLPVGTQVELTPQTWSTLLTTGTAITATPMATLPAPTTALSWMTGWGWPALDDAMGILLPQGAQTAATTGAIPLLPNPATPQTMPAAILFFMAALGAGDAGGWMGERAVAALRREGARGADILGRLTRDFTALSRIADDSGGQDWRGVSIPMQWQSEISRINLYYRQHQDDRDEDKDSDGQRGTRFIFDLHLGRIGPLQLDGYMKDKRLDLILRSTAAFSRAMQTDMRQIYLGVLETGGLSGDLAFQTRADQWIQVGVRVANVQTSA